MTASGSIPDEVLPDGWAPAGDDLTFEHTAAGLAVCADREPGDAAGTTGAPCGWRVWYERRVGEATECWTVGTVTTRDAAIDALLSCMRRVSAGPAERPGRTLLPETDADTTVRLSATDESRDASTDFPDAPVDGRWTALSTLADGVALRDAVPTVADGEGGVDAAAYARSWAAKLDGK